MRLILWLCTFYFDPSNIFLIVVLTVNMTVKRFYFWNEDYHYYLKAYRGSHRKPFVCNNITFYLQYYSHVKKRYIY